MCALVDDLHRCRRLVACMRSEVLAPTFKRQALAELVVEVARRQEAGIRSWQEGQITPRKRYQTLRLRKCARTIQWCWRSFRRRQRIHEMCELERKWNEQGAIHRSVVSILKIQSIFRGYRIRKHAHDRRALLRYLRRPRRVSVLIKFKGDRAAYQVALKRINQEQAQLMKDREYATTALAHTELVVASCKKTAGGTRRNTRGGTPMVHIDVKLLDGSSVRMEPRSLVAHWKSELDRLDGVEIALQERETMIKMRHPVLHAATSLIQAAYRGLQRRREYTQLRRRMRRVRMRLVASGAWCEARMNVGMNERREQLIKASVTTIASIYRVHRARKILNNLRRERAAHVIYITYCAMRARVVAKKRVGEKRRHRQHGRIAHKHATMTLTRRVWSAWLTTVVARRAWVQKVHDLRQKGELVWRTANASRIAKWWKAQLNAREQTKNLLLPQISPSVLEMLQTAISSTIGDYSEYDGTTISKTHVKSVRDVFSRFRELVLQLIWQWREPHGHMYVFARKHNLELDELPLGELWVWIGSVLGADHSIVDLLPPLLPCGLALLADLSRFHVAYERVERQSEVLWTRYEAVLAMRSCLAQLLNQDLIAESKALDFRWRQCASFHLREENLHDRVGFRWAMPMNQNSNGMTEDHMDLFTQFYCQWSGNLCEKCFALQPSAFGSSPTKTKASLHRKCRDCGHRHYERSTVSKPPLTSHVISPAFAGEAFGLGKWISTRERCDFFVANAFLHALAPADSSNRKHLSPEELWRAALEHAQSAGAWLYDRHGITSLDSLLSFIPSSASMLQSDCLPPVVVDKLLLFAEVLLEQLHLVMTTL